MIEGGRLRRALLSTVAVAVVVAGAPSAVAADVQSQQWYLDAMHADEIWKTTTGKGIKVALIDTGVNSSTPSLQGQVLKGLDAAEADGDETDDYTGHGTTMAELIVGTGKGGGLKGLAPGAKVIPYRVSNTQLQNEQAVNAFDMQEAIKAAADSDAQIINVSFGSEYYNEDIREAVQYAHGKGKLLFASVGNEAKEGNKKTYPAAYPEAIAVAATDQNGVVEETSQHGDYVDIAAPGADIPGWCDKNFKSYCTAGGTSNASAIASASAALIWSAHPDWTGNQVLRAMFESAARSDDWKPGTVSTYLGHGIVRPNANISRGEGNPGDPNISPLTNEPTGGAAAGSATPSTAPSATTSEGASTAPSATASTQAPDGKPTSGSAVAGSTESAASTEDGGSATGIVIGAVAAVVVLAGVGVVIARKRRTA
ncbi:type VII secretion-associated serine protease mycosin [Streptomyces roseofulvus]|uniref:S8 family serine peptidase n=1 Tax=Streptomyces roseofulvus TaxID=33902 RepID=UPI0031FD5B2F